MKTYALIKDNQAISFATFETPPVIAVNKGTWVEVNDPGQPAYDTETQVCESSSRMYYGKWKVEYTVRDKTPLELWPYHEYSMRIVAPDALIMQAPAVVAWFQLKGLPIVMKDDTVYLYCNFIQPQHQALVDQYQGVITIEEIPNE